VEFTVMLSTFGDHASPEAFRRLAREAENQEFDAVWAGDHVVFPEDVPAEYPFSRDGTPPPSFHVDSEAYDVFTILSHLAAITDEVDLGINTCIVPYRNPVVLTKMAFSLEALSDGRLDMGVAPGWLRTEFEALGVPFEERGTRTDEFLEIFDTARKDGRFAFDGPHHSFDEAGFYPTPEAGRPKMWIGGVSGASFRRVGQYGDGWTTVWDRPDGVREGHDRAMNAWRDFEREGEPEIALMRAVHCGSDTDLDTSRPLIGEPENVIEDLREYEEAGLTRLTMDFFTTDIDEQVEQVRRFGEEVVPAFR
jgi:probable F420-dependent oxidoreductase